MEILFSILNLTSRRYSWTEVKIRPSAEPALCDSRWAGGLSGKEWKVSLFIAAALCGVKGCSTCDLNALCGSRHPNDSCVDEPCCCESVTVSECVHTVCVVWEVIINKGRRVPCINKAVGFLQLNIYCTFTQLYVY